VDGSTNTTIREAVGVFHDADALNEAVSALISAGVDRAELSLMAQASILEGNLVKSYRNTRAAADLVAHAADDVHLHDIAATSGAPSRRRARRA
jgi:hypothetical protein